MFVPDPKIPLENFLSGSTHQLFHINLHSTSMQDVSSVVQTARSETRLVPEDPLAYQLYKLITT